MRTGYLSRSGSLPLGRESGNGDLVQKILVSLVLAISISGWSQTSPTPTQDSGFNGRWEGTLAAIDGNEYVEKYTFKVDGTTLTGSVTSGNASIDISDGKIFGNEIYFHTDLNGVKILHNGTLSGDTIQMTIDYQGMKFALTLKRSAPTPPAAPPPRMDHKSLEICRQSPTRSSSG
jgi:hypothetical protein